MILRVYNISYGMKKYFIFNNTPNIDEKCAFGYNIKDLIRHYAILGCSHEFGLLYSYDYELVIEKEYNSIEELKLDYVEYLIWHFINLKIKLQI